MTFLFFLQCACCYHIPAAHGCAQCLFNNVKHYFIGPSRLTNQMEFGTSSVVTYPVGGPLRPINSLPIPTAIRKSLVDKKLLECGGSDIPDEHILLDADLDRFNISISCKKLTFRDDKEPQQPESTRLTEYDEDFLKQVMLDSILWYKTILSPILPKRCRFLPTCSSYGLEAIQRFGPWQGGLLTAWRILRCNPFGGSGYDPVMWPPPGYWAGSNSKRRK